MKRPLVIAGILALLVAVVGSFVAVSHPASAAPPTGSDGHSGIVSTQLGV